MNLCPDSFQVSRFIQEVLGDWYRPNEHWTSSLRSKAGHTPLSNDAVGCSTFTIQDTSGNLKTSLVQMGCEEAKSLTDPATFHFQVVVTGEALHSSFTLASAQAEKVNALYRALFCLLIGIKFKGREALQSSNEDTHCQRAIYSRRCVLT